MRLSFLFFLASMVMLVSARYGNKWDFGRYYMPRSVLSADGMTYKDGDEIWEPGKSLIDSGWEEEAWLLVVGIVALALFLIVQKTLREKAWHREERRMWAILKEAERLVNAGRFEEARPLIRQHDEWSKKQGWK